MTLQVEIQDLRRMLSEKCEEIIRDRNLAYEFYVRICEVEEDDRFTVVDNLTERKTAHWIFGNTMGHSWMKCSECCVSQSGQRGCWTYCPNCGAEMKGETEVEID